MPEKLRPGSGALLQKSRTELGRASETHLNETRALYRLQHVPLYSEGNERRHFQKDAVLLQGKQPLFT